mmetsp:Transcript_15885/g.48420  ORF Transcript_15885/g.48420 Transcript_15885/m.48420 type:complete len:297 (+) Transcript_15885:1189-2079(+)
MYRSGNERDTTSRPLPPLRHFPTLLFSQRKACYHNTRDSTATTPTTSGITNFAYSCILFLLFSGILRALRPPAPFPSTSSSSHRSSASSTSYKIAFAGLRPISPFRAGMLSRRGWSTFFSTKQQTLRSTPPCSSSKSSILLRPKAGLLCISYYSLSFTVTVTVTGSHEVDSIDGLAEVVHVLYDAFVHARKGDVRAQRLPDKGEAVFLEEDELSRHGLLGLAALLGDDALAPECLELHLLPLDVNQERRRLLSPRREVHAERHLTSLHVLVARDLMETRAQQREKKMRTHARSESA